MALLTSYLNDIAYALKCTYANITEDNTSVGINQCIPPEVTSCPIVACCACNTKHYNDFVTCITALRNPACTSNFTSNALLSQAVDCDGNCVGGDVCVFDNTGRLTKGTISIKSDFQVTGKGSCPGQISGEGVASDGTHLYEQANVTIPYGYYPPNTKATIKGTGLGTLCTTGCRVYVGTAGYFQAGSATGSTAANKTVEVTCYNCACKAAGNITFTTNAATGSCNIFLSNGYYTGHYNSAGTAQSNASNRTHFKVSASYTVPVKTPTVTKATTTTPFSISGAAGYYSAFGPYNISNLTTNALSDLPAGYVPTGCCYLNQGKETVGTLTKDGGYLIIGMGSDYSYAECLNPFNCLRYCILNHSSLCTYTTTEPWTHAFQGSCDAELYGLSTTGGSKLFSIKSCTGYINYNCCNWKINENSDGPFSICATMGGGGTCICVYDFSLNCKFGQFWYGIYATSIYVYSCCRSGAVLCYR